jgi:hypothetical protein
MTSFMTSEDGRNLSSTILNNTVDYVLNLGGCLVCVSGRLPVPSEKKITCL